MTREAGGEALRMPLAERARRRVSKPLLYRPSESRRTSWVNMCPGKVTGGRGGAMRGWMYKTDEEGRPRRFLSHREAAWWAALKTGTLAGPVVLYAFLTAFLETAGPGMPLAQRAIYFFVPTALIVLWLCVVGAVYLYLVLSGGVMGETERRRYREDDGAGPA